MTRAEVERVIAWANRVEYECNIVYRLMLEAYEAEVLPFLPEPGKRMFGRGAQINRIGHHAEILARVLRYDLAKAATLDDLRTDTEE